MKALQEKGGGTIYFISTTKDFLNGSYSKGNKINNYQIGSHETEKLLSGKETVKQMNRQPIGWEMIFTSYDYSRGV